MFTFNVINRKRGADKRSNTRTNQNI